MKLIDYNELSCRIRIFTSLAIIIILDINLFTIRSLYISFSMTVLSIYVLIESIVSTIVADYNRKEIKNILEENKRVDSGK